MSQHSTAQRAGTYSCGLLLFLALYLAHERFCLIILAGHDVADT